MSTAAERAEARRRAILSRGSDRLAKLTTSARGEDAAYLHDESPAPRSTSLNDFVGESSDANMPIRRVSPSPASQPLTATSPTASDTTAFSSLENADPNVWTPEHQQRFIQALMAGAQQHSAAPNHSHPMPRKVSQQSSDPGSREESPFDPPLVSIFPAGQKGMNPTTEEQKSKTLMQKLVPVMHMLAMWCLLLWFGFWAGGQYSLFYEGSGVMKQHFWERWADLSRRSPQFIIQQDTGVNLFWGFATLQVVLHSIRLFSGFDTLRPPAFLSLVLPHLPPQISTFVVSGLRYLQMGSMLLDDIAWVLVGLGFLVYVANWITS
ncbi:hypothetical protein APHAL10511_008188 [Amanita phalloides]|nr:hypothetical protein APHAL10511_008188 [Amanita phalloides]